MKLCFVYITYLCRQSIIPTKEQPEPNGDEHARMDEDVVKEQRLITELKQQVPIYCIANFRRSKPHK